MFEDIGSKLKGLAKVVCWIGIISSVIYAIVIWNMSGPNGGISGLLTLVLGCLVSWVGSWACYGIGEAADQSTEIRRIIHQLDIMEKQLNDIQAAAKAGLGTVTPTLPNDQTPVPGAKGSIPNTENKRAPVQKIDRKSALEYLDEATKKPLYQAIQYALKFNTDNGMIEYLRDAKKSAAERNDAAAEECIERILASDSPRITAQSELSKLLQ